MNGIAEKRCGTCEDVKPAAAFRKVPIRFGGDGLSKDCKDCGRTKRAAKVRETEAPVPEQEITGPHVISRPSLGFKAYIDGDGDLVITQNTENLGEQAIWFSPAERAELARFLATLSVGGGDAA